MKKTDRINLLIAKLCYGVSGFATSVIMLYLPIYVFHFTSSYIAVSMIFTLPAIMSFIGQNIWGYSASSTGKIKFFILTSIISYLIFFISVFMTKNPISLIIILGILSFFHIAMVPVIKAYITILHPHKKGQALGEFSSFESIGWAIGSTTGMILFMHNNDIMRIYLLFKILLYITSVLTVITVFLFKEPGITIKENKKEDIAEKFKFIYTSRKIQTEILILLSINMPRSLFFSMFSIFFCDYINGGKDLLGFSMSIACFTGALAYYVYGKIADRWNSAYLVYGAAFAYMSLFFTFIFVKNPLVITFYYALPFYPAVNIATGKQISEVTEEDERSMALGALDGAYSACNIIAPLISGAAVTYLGLSNLPLVSLIVLIIGFSSVHFSRLRTR